VLQLKLNTNRIPCSEGCRLALAKIEGHKIENENNIYDPELIKCTSENVTKNNTFLMQKYIKIC